MTRHTIFDSSGLALHFQDDESYKRFKEDEKQLYLKYYKEIRAKHGIWAGNQDRFVFSVEELNDWDSKYMERLLAKEEKK